MLQLPVVIFVIQCNKSIPRVSIELIPYYLLHYVICEGSFLVCLILFIKVKELCLPNSTHTVIQHGGHPGLEPRTSLTPDLF